MSQSKKAPTDKPQQISFSKEDVRISKREAVYQGFCQLYRLDLQHKLYAGDWSQSINRECMIRKAAVSVLAYDPRLDKVVLVRQFRIGAYLRSNVTPDLDAKRDDPWVIECVAGLMDQENEDPMQTAKRELKEESAMSAINMQLVHDVYVSPGASNERALLYYAEVDASEAGGIHGLDAEDEDIAVVVFSWDEFEAAKQAGKINNSQCLLAFYWLQQNRTRLRGNVDK